MADISTYRRIFACPYCGEPMRVNCTRHPTPDTVRRYRICIACKARVWTCEKIIHQRKAKVSH